MSDANSRFEERAARFYADTLMLAPGKDSATNDCSYEERQAAWLGWNSQQHRVKSQQAHIKALEKAIQKAADTAYDAINESEERMNEAVVAIHDSLYVLLEASDE